jgi:hypothetical protein
MWHQENSRKCAAQARRAARRGALSNIARRLKIIPKNQPSRAHQYVLCAIWNFFGREREAEGIQELLKHLQKRDEARAAAVKPE